MDQVNLLRPRLNDVVDMVLTTRHDLKRPNSALSLSLERERDNHCGIIIRLYLVLDSETLNCPPEYARNTGRRPVACAKIIRF